jgi:integrase
MTTMDRSYSGTLRETRPGVFCAQFSTGASRRSGTIRAASRVEAERRQLAVARLVAKLREAGYPALIKNTIRDACAAPDGEELRKVSTLVARIVAGKEPGIARQLGARREGTTVADLADDWTSGKLAEQYPDHVRTKRTSADDEARLRWLCKVRMLDGSTFGERPIASVTLDDCDHVMGALPKTAEAPASRRHYAQSLRKLLTYAVYPLRLLAALPIPKGWLPKGGNALAKAWLYPSEDLALMQCRDVPLVRRVFYGLLVREGVRVSEALGLTWADLDLERGVLRLDTNKTDDPRSWVMGADVTRALKAWKALRGSKAKKVPRVFPSALLGSRFNMAKWLREGLEAADVERPELTKSKAGRLRLRAHDLRGSFVTLALATGRTEAWVTDRTGHKSSSMVYRYKRASRTAAELNLGWFAPLDEAIPELAPKPRRGANGVQTGGPGGRQASRRGSKTSGKEHLGAGRTPAVATLNPLADSSSLSWPTPPETIGAARILDHHGGLSPAPPTAIASRERPTDGPSTGWSAASRAWIGPRFFRGRPR